MYVSRAGGDGGERVGDRVGGRRGVRGRGGGERPGRAGRHGWRFDGHVEKPIMYWPTPCTKKSPDFFLALNIFLSDDFFIKALVPI